MKDTIIDELQDKLDKEESFFRSFEFGVGVGVVTSLALVISTGYALGNVK